MPVLLKSNLIECVSIDEFGSTLGVKCILSSVLLLDAVTGSSNGTQQICHLISEDVQHLEHLLQLVQLGSQMHKQHPGKRSVGIVTIPIYLNTFPFGRFERKHSSSFW